jgi:hypothetical protein
MMGAMYLDRVEGRPWNPGAAQSLIALVCWLIDTLHYRPGPAPMLAAPVEIGAPSPVDDPSATVRIDVAEAIAEPAEPKAVDEDVDAAASDRPERDAEELSSSGFEPEEPRVPELETSFEIELEPEAPAVPDVETGPEVEFEPESPADLESGIEADEAGFVPDEAVPLEVPAADIDIPTEVAPPEVQMPATAVDLPEPQPEGTGFLDEPPPVKPVQPPPDVPEDEVSAEEARQEEARRFARLLVSEIKLYNEEQVERGREAKDIYRRLKEDIDRSQEMFDKRISAEIRAGSNFFRDELVRVLADGDPEALGM